MSSVPGSFTCKRERSPTTQILNTCSSNPQMGLPLFQNANSEINSSNLFNYADNIPTDSISNEQPTTKKAKTDVLETKKEIYEAVKNVAPTREVAKAGIIVKCFYLLF